ncbi:MAG TPA: carboxypeptidase regulatory-like domain-containing protein [Gemmatimonadaceae bacterium]|nr:carboxypeptidase regulatory-like domain-containing protein [Gemmatimonadaceae bacterium]
MAFATAFGLLVPGDVPGQTITRVTGRVVSHTTHTGISGATISVPELGRSTTTDSAGRYLIGGFPPGRFRFLVRVIPYSAKEATLLLERGDHRTLDFELDSAGAQTLPAVPVTATAPVDLRLRDFERRRRTGRGQYLSEEQIKQIGAATVADATRGMRGVDIHCGGGGGCHIQMVRAPMNCGPDYVIDGRVDNTFGPQTPIRDIVALEVYTGPSDVPGEFAGATAGCGVVAVWTRSGPPPRKP